MKNKITYLRFDLQGCFYAGVEGHPSTVLKKLGINIIGWEGCPMADCVFVATNSDVTTLPDFIEISQRKIALYDGVDFGEITEEDKKTAYECWHILKQGNKK